MVYLYVLQQALVWIVTIFWLYQLIVSICSLVKLKDKPLKVKKEHRFMAIIPAHNEEEVVGNLKEVNISVLGNSDNVSLSEIEEVLPSHDFLTYEDKYVGNGKKALLLCINKV